MNDSKMNNGMECFIEIKMKHLQLYITFLSVMNDSKVRQDASSNITLKSNKTAPVIYHFLSVMNDSKVRQDIEITLSNIAWYWNQTETPQLYTTLL